MRAQGGRKEACSVCRQAPAEKWTKTGPGGSKVSSAALWCRVGQVQEVQFVQGKKRPLCFMKRRRENCLNFRPADV